VGADAIAGSGENVPVTPRRWTAAGLAVFALSAGQVLYRYLYTRPGELWQLDLEVYRDGAVNLLRGYPIYDWLTGAPQFLPFTYPPFAALAAVPLAVVPFTVAGWLWSLLQLALLWWGVSIAFRPLLQRFSQRSGLVCGVLAAALVQTLPVSDGFRFGQVNAVVVTLCLVDLAGSRRTRSADARPSDAGPTALAPLLPRGALIGLAAAVKLTPAAFWVHFAVARRWRALVASVVAAATATVVTAAVLPSASAAFWTDALLDPERLGPNSGTSNQSVRGALMRVGPQSESLRTALWLLAVVAVAGFGFWLSARLDHLGEQVAVVGAVGMVAVLVSPVSWIHHWHWGIAVVGALVGDGRVRPRVVAAAAVYLVLLLPLPWWGGAWPGHGPLVTVLGRIVEQSYTLLALGALLALWRLVAVGSEHRRSGGAEGAEQGEYPEGGAHAGPDPAHQREPEPLQQGTADQRRDA
jgi:alpha-1,2-mannosyltransferase